MRYVFQKEIERADRQRDGLNRKKQTDRDRDRQIDRETERKDRKYRETERQRTD